MRRDEISAATHGDLPFANPLSPAAIDAAVAALDLAPGARVLDIGCGKGELLLRIARAHPGVRTAGIEPSAAWARVARERGVDEVHETTLADVALDPPYDLVTCVASTHAFGAWDDALRATAELAPIALVGEGFWRRTPSAGYLEALGGASEDELPTHDALLAGARAAGWTVAAETVASDNDWAAYEDTCIRNGEAALARAQDDDLRAWVDAARARWDHPDARDTLGFTLLTLVQ